MKFSTQLSLIEPKFGHYGLQDQNCKRLTSLLELARQRLQDVQDVELNTDVVAKASEVRTFWSRQRRPLCNWFLLPCRKATCTAKCRSSNYTIYIYSHDDMRVAAKKNLSEEMLRFGGAGTSQIINELRRSQRITQNATEACYFIAENKGRHVYKLQDLPYWNFGINHIVLDFLDGKVRQQSFLHRF